MEESPVVRISSDEQEIYNLEIKKKDFKDFLEGILGDRRNISKNLPISFLVDLPDLVNLHQRIYQRVFTQQVSVVDTFLAVIEFADRSEKKIHDKNAFELLNESSSSKVVRLSLNYTFLIQYTGRAFPEKQEIRIAFATDKLVKNRRNRVEIELDLPRETFPEIMIEVDYTNITWGEDLLGMIDRYCRDRFWLKGSFPRDDTRFFILFVAWISLLISSIFLIKYFWFYRENLIWSKRAMLLARSNPSQINDRIDALLIDANSLSLGWTDLIHLLWASVPVIMLITIITLLTRITFRSFITLNNKMKENCKEEHEANRLLFISAFVALLVGVFASLTANYLPIWISQHLGLG